MASDAQKATVEAAVVPTMAVVLATGDVQNWNADQIWAHWRSLTQEERSCFSAENAMVARACSSHYTALHVQRLVAWEWKQAQEEETAAGAAATAARAAAAHEAAAAEPTMAVVLGPANVKN